MPFNSAAIALSAYLNYRRAKAEVVRMRGDLAMDPFNLRDKAVC
jgi:hypothetical protein